MKKILFLSFLLFIGGFLVAQTTSPDSRLSADQVLKNALKKQDGTNLPVLRLVPVTATSNPYNATSLSKDQIINGLFRKMPDGTFAIAVDNALIGAGGGGGATDASAVTTTTAMTIGSTAYPVGTSVQTVLGALNSGAGAGLTTAAITVGATTLPIGSTVQSVLNALNAATPPALTTFTGTTIPDNSTYPAALQALETVAEAAIPKASLTAKGALISASAANTPVTLPAGTNGQILVANSTTPTGLEWVAAAAGTTVIDNLTTTTTTAALSANQGKVLQDTKQTNVQFQNAATNLGTAGTATTLNFTGGATATRVGDVVTVNVATTPLALYSDDVEAAAGGVAIGSSYYLDFDNPFGASIGMVKVRIN